MKDIKSIVLESHQEILDRNNMDIKSDLNTTVGRESGLDSIGIVEFVISLEDRLDRNLDPIISQIRQSKTLNDIVGLIENLEKN